MEQMLNYFIVPSYINMEGYKINTQCSYSSTMEPKLSQQFENLQKKYALLKKRYQILEKQNDSLKLQIEDLQANKPQIRKRKFRRRSENQLNKDFKCKFEGCLKEYASQVALNLHMKMKHNAGTKKQRLVVIKQILQADGRGDPLPQIQISLPPNYQQVRLAQPQEYQKALQLENERILFNKQKQRIEYKRQSILDTDF